MRSRKVLLVLSLIGSLLWLTIFSFPDNKLHLVFCDVGQGDATLITKGFNQILIDGGPNDKVLQCLSNNMPFFDKTIEIVALTHPEADHMTGLISVLDKYKVDYFLTGPEGNNSAVFAELSNKLESFCKATPCKKARGRLINPYAGEKIKLGEIELDSWWPEKEWVAERISNIATEQHSYLGGAVLGASTTTKLNQFSLVFLLNYKNHKVLLMGDGDSSIQDRIIGLQETVNSQGIDILKFPHHGSKTGMLESFLKQIQPKEAVISVGKNSYGHPTQEALDLLKRFNVTVRRTDIEGEIKYSF